MFSYRGFMARSRAWHALRGRRHHAPNGTSSPTAKFRGPRVATVIAAERVRAIWPSDSKFEEWKSLEFRDVKPPSDEHWNR